MRLITHNMLACTARGVENGFPLAIENAQVEARESEFDGDFIRRTVPRLDWPAFAAAAAALGVDGLQPDAPPSEEQMASDDFLQLVHRALLDMHVVEGELVCPESGRRFPITNGIPNMLLLEDEV